MHEMERTINNSAPNKSAGENDIPYELIQHLEAKAKENPPHTLQTIVGGKGDTQEVAHYHYQTTSQGR